MKRLALAGALSLPPEGLGVFRVSLWEDVRVLIENHSGVADLKPECVKVWHGKRLMAVSGEKLRIEELDGTNLRIKGKILSIEYLT